MVHGNRYQHRKGCFFCQQGNAVFIPVTDDLINPLDGFNGSGICLGMASGYHEAAFRIVAKEFSDFLTGLGRRFRRYRTGVDDA